MARTPRAHRVATGGSAALSDMAGGQAAELDALRARLDDLERLVDAERRRGDGHGAHGRAGPSGRLDLARAQARAG